MDEFGDTDPLLEHSDGDDDDERSDPSCSPGPGCSKLRLALIHD